MKHKIFSLLGVIVVLSMLATSVAALPVSSPALQFGRGGGNPVAADAQQAAGGKPAKSEIDPNKAVRVIVQLEDAPLATYAGGVAGLEATSPSATGKKLDVNSEAGIKYAAYLAAKQSAFREQLFAVSPTATVDHQYRVVFNGLSVRTRAGDVDAIRALPGVLAVTPEREYKLEMDASLPLIGLGSGSLGEASWVDSGLWTAVGGHANAGIGLKVADIDSGITPEHPCFSGTGYSYPAGFPKYDPGDATIVNGKIIVARHYFRLDDPPQYVFNARDDPLEGDGGHGTHTAGTMVCNYGTNAIYGNLKISGVAPKAYLMVYRVFYASVSGSHSAHDPELLAAIDDAVADGADVVNNSWGGTAVDVATDPLVLAYSAAVDAGVVVVFSAGNSGPGAMTLGSPGLGEKFITVGASTTSRTFTTTLSATSTTSPSLTIPPTMTNIIARSITVQSVTAPTIDLAVEGYGDPLACPVADGGLGPLPSSLVSGKIVVIRRGVCALVDKVANAAAGGAVGVVLRNVAGGATTLPLINPILPTAHVSQANGDNIFNWLSYLKSQGITATFTINGPAVMAYSDAPDTLASFSSRGPTPDLRLKPDLVAPGVNILSSVSYGNGFDFYQGTSMAAPHVTGAAALLKQLHPDWTPAQIKSALMTTAAEPSSLGASPNSRGSGRLNLAAPNDPGLTFDLPSLSFGLMAIGQTVTKTVTAKNVGSTAASYTLTAQIQSGTATVVVPAYLSPSGTGSLLLPPGATQTFNVVLTATGSPGDAYGKIILSDGTVTHTLHIPFWVRKVTDLGPADVLLVDDDQLFYTGSAFVSCGGANYQGVYTQTLTNLGLTYKVWDVGANGGAIDFNQMRRYSKVVYFSGDPGCGVLGAYTNLLRNYLAQGGKMLITGEDIGWFFSPNWFDAGSSLALYFGAAYVQDSLFDVPNKPIPAMTGDTAYSTYLAGQSYDIHGTGDGAGNQVSVDEIAARFYNDVDSLPILYGAPVTNTMQYGHVGTRMSSEPTIERVKGMAPWTTLGYRTQYLSFGLEGVNNDTGFNTREELLDRLLNWMDDEVSVQFTAASFKASGPYAPATVTVNATTSVTTTTTGYTNEVLLYRWDFGDGSPIQTTTVPTATHGYANFGFYQVYVEVTDGFGHKAVAGPVVVEVGSHLYLPIVIR